MTQPRTPTKTDEVTADNLSATAAEGFEFLTNIGWPPEAFSMDPDCISEAFWLQGLRDRHGWEAVRLGHPMSPETGKPDPNFRPGEPMVSVFLKRSE